MRAASINGTLARITQCDVNRYSGYSSRTCGWLTSRSPACTNAGMTRLILRRRSELAEAGMVATLQLGQRGEASDLDLLGEALRAIRVERHHPGLELAQQP